MKLETFEVGDNVQIDTGDVMTVVDIKNIRNRKITIIDDEGIKQLYPIKYLKNITIDRWNLKSSTPNNIIYRTSNNGYVFIFFEQDSSKWHVQTRENERYFIGPGSGGFFQSGNVDEKIFSTKRSAMLYAFKFMHKKIIR